MCRVSAPVRLDASGRPTGGRDLIAIRMAGACRKRPLRRKNETGRAWNRDWINRSVTVAGPEKTNQYQVFEIEL
jgi:hypothetical protein